jgi:hypothetical protein
MALWNNYSFVTLIEAFPVTLRVGATGLGNKVGSGSNGMKKTALLAAVLAAAACPAMAKSHRVYQQNNPATHSSITCEMVRSYVAQVGVEQARAMAQAAGMTAAEEARARHCLAHKA